MTTCTKLKTLTTEEYQKRKQALSRQGDFLQASKDKGYITSPVNFSQVSPDRYLSKTVEVFHLDLGQKAIYCIAQAQKGKRKVSSEFFYCVHHNGSCPHCKGGTHD